MGTARGGAGIARTGQIEAPSPQMSGDNGDNEEYEYEDEDDDQHDEQYRSVRVIDQLRVPGFVSVVGAALLGLRSQRRRCVGHRSAPIGAMQLDEYLGFETDAENEGSQRES